MEHTTTQADRRERVCRTCPGLGRDGEGDRPAPNYFEYRWACEECRPQLHGLLHRIPHSYAELDATPGGGQREHVSGTADTPLGVRLAVLNETYIGPGNTMTVLPTGPDQEGTLNAPRILWYIASAWLPTWQNGHPDAALPTPYVAYLAEWLDHRLDWACNTLEALIGDHAAYLAALARRLDRLVDPRSSKPEGIPFVPCRECDRFTLARQSDPTSGFTVICTGKGCNVRMSTAEYERWTKLTAEAAKQAA